MEKNTNFKWNIIYKNDGTKNLPKKEDTYLVSTIYGEQGQIRTNSYTCYFNADCSWEVIDADIVVAWAPIPDPYLGAVDLSFLAE